MSKSTIFQSCWDDFQFSWVELVLSRGYSDKRFAQGQESHDTVPGLAGLSHPFLGMGPGPMELGKLAAF